MCCLLNIVSTLLNERHSATKYDHKLLVSALLGSTLDPGAPSMAVTAATLVLIIRIGIGF